MTDPDDNVRERYRRLGNEEPPPALDAAILASARRAVSRPTMRWSGPVSIAAVLMLAVGVTLRMRQEEPGIETSMPSEYATPAPAEPAAPAPQFEESRRALDATREADAIPKAAAPAAKPAPAPKVLADQMAQQAQPRDRAEAKSKDATPERQQAKKEDAQAFADKPAKLSVAPAEAPASPAVTAAPEPAPRPQASPVPPSVPAQEKNRMEALPAAPPPAARADTMERSAAGVAAPSLQSAETRAKRVAPAAAPSAPSPLAKEAFPDPLVRELERIAALRREGRHAEADKALVEFRRVNPDYRIPDPVWEQVKPR